MVNGRAAMRCFPALLFADDSRTTSPARVVGGRIQRLQRMAGPRPARISA
jgi:hypothetical protein